MSVGAVVIAPHILHSCRRSYQLTALVSSSHITVILNILLPQIQARVGMPVRSILFLVVGFLVIAANELSNPNCRLTLFDLLQIFKTILTSVSKTTPQEGCGADL